MHQEEAHATQRPCFAQKDIGKGEREREREKDRESEPKEVSVLANELTCQYPFLVNHKYLIARFKLKRAPFTHTEHSLIKITSMN